MCSIGCTPHHTISKTLHSGCTLIPKGTKSLFLYLTFNHDDHNDDDDDNDDDEDENDECYIWMNLDQ